MSEGLFYASFYPRTSMEFIVKWICRKRREGKLKQSLTMGIFLLWEAIFCPMRKGFMQSAFFARRSSTSLQKFHNEKKTPRSNVNATYRVAFFQHLRQLPIENQSKRRKQLVNGVVCALDRWLSFTLDGTRKDESSCRCLKACWYLHRSKQNKTKNGKNLWERNVRKLVEIFLKSTEFSRCDGILIFCEFKEFLRGGHTFFDDSDWNKRKTR